MTSVIAIQNVGEELNIGGFTPLTTIDFPECLSAVVFLQGCPWRCRYCHNPTLIQSASKGHYSWQKIQQFLLKRQGLLDAVVFSGGEPLLQAAVLPAIEYTRQLGFKIGLHCSGSVPSRFVQALLLVDWVGFDIKATQENYTATTGSRTAVNHAWQCLALLVASTTAYEVRTTVHSDLISPVELLQLAENLSLAGVSHYVVQLARTDNCLDATLGPNLYSDSCHQWLWQKIGSKFENFYLRD